MRGLLGKAAEALGKALSAASVGKPLYEQGVPTRPAETAKAEEPARNAGEQRDRDERWRYSPAATQDGFDGAMSGKIATDGSLINREPVSARRGGW